MNRTEFKVILDRLEAFLNKLPALPLDKRVQLLGEHDRDFTAIRRFEAHVVNLKSAADRFYREARQYVRDTGEQQRNTVFKELESVRFHAHEFSE